MKQISKSSQTQGYFYNFFFTKDYKQIFFLQCLIQARFELHFIKHLINVLITSDRSNLHSMKEEDHEENIRRRSTQGIRTQFSSHLPNHHEED